jgi:phosphate-selective porin OprO/OprP
VADFLATCKDYPPRQKAASFTIDQALAKMSYHWTIVSEKGGGTLSFGGFYVYGSWFVTGESRPYDRTAGVFSRVRPRRDFSFRGGGLGAVELGVRYSHVDQNDGAIRGGILDIGTIGLNWYWTPFLETRVNVNFAGVSGRPPGGILQIFHGRFELDF